MRNTNNNNICYITKQKKYGNDANMMTAYMKMTCDGCATTTPTLYVAVI